MLETGGIMNTGSLIPGLGSGCYDSGQLRRCGFFSFLSSALPWCCARERTYLIFSCLSFSYHPHAQVKLIEAFGVVKVGSQVITHQPLIPRTLYLRGQRGNVEEEERAPSRVGGV
jgi:hypothetical protein